MTGNFYVDFLYFMIYSFFGWVCEVVYCSILARKWINRGFLNGPYCPIYGMGAILVISLLTPFSHSILLTFFFGIILTSLLEYSTGFALETIFHTKWWDYSHQRFQIKGRVCLTNSILFGILTVAAIFVVHPVVTSRIGELSYEVVRLLAVLFALIVFIDTFVTIRSILLLNQSITYLKDLSAQAYKRLEKEQLHMEELWIDYIERMKENLNLSPEAAKLKEKLKSHILQLSPFEQFSARRLLEAFPKMKPKKLNMQLGHFIKTIEELRLERRNKKKGK
jgi:uncharacterized membrane protein